MPIVHVHSPIQSIELSSMLEATYRPMDWYLEQLGSLSAQATVLEPGYVADITPLCFQPELGIPDVQFSVVVDETDDQAIIAGGGTGGLPGVFGFSRQTRGLQPGISIQNSVHIPRDVHGAPLGRGGTNPFNGEYRVQVGGYIMQLLDPEEVAQTLARFERPNQGRSPS